MHACACSDPYCQTHGCRLQEALAASRQIPGAPQIPAPPMRWPGTVPTEPTGPVGWVCPVCRRGVAPFMPSCPSCPQPSTLQTPTEIP